MVKINLSLTSFGKHFISMRFERNWISILVELKRSPYCWTQTSFHEANILWTSKLFQKYLIFEDNYDLIDRLNDVCLLFTVYAEISERSRLPLILSNQMYAWTDIHYIQCTIYNCFKRKLLENWVCCCLLWRPLLLVTPQETMPTWYPL